MTQDANAISLPAGAADIPVARFVFIDDGGDRGLATADAADAAKAIGVSLEPYDHSEFLAGGASNSIPVAYEGVVNVEVAEAVQYGDPLIVADGGFAGLIPIFSLGGDLIMGIALGDAQVNELVPMFFVRNLQF